MRTSIRSPVLCNKKGSSCFSKLPHKSPISTRHPYVGIIQIRFSVEGHTFLSACNTSSRLFNFFINMVIHHYEGNYNLVYRKRCRNSRTQGKTGRIPIYDQELSILISMAQIVSKTCAIYIYYNNLQLLLCPFIRIILWKSD